MVIKKEINQSPNNIRRKKFLSLSSTNQDIDIIQLLK